MSPYLKNENIHPNFRLQASIENSEKLGFGLILKNSKIIKFVKWCTVICPKSNLEASAGLETSCNRFFVHKSPNLDHNFAKKRNFSPYLLFFCWTKMTFFDHCWQFDSACHIISNQRKSFQIFDSI